MPPTLKLTAASLDGGRALAELNAKIDLLVKDLLEREDIEKERKATLEITIKPGVDPMDGNLMPFINWSVQHKVPGESGKITRAFLKDGQLKVRCDGDHPYQGHFFDEENTTQKPSNVKTIGE